MDGTSLGWVVDNRRKALANLNAARAAAAKIPELEKEIAAHEKEISRCLCDWKIIGPDQGTPAELLDALTNLRQEWRPL